MSRYRSSPAEDESERELQVQSEPFQAAKWFSGLFRVRATEVGKWGSCIEFQGVVHPKSGFCFPRTHEADE